MGYHCVNLLLPQQPFNPLSIILSLLFLNCSERKLFAIEFSYTVVSEACCLPVKMTSKAVIKSMFCKGRWENGARRK